jgi:hypothetical protein|tara:strand:+ start:718 stop:1338 length:621 start_codon:yes stop_codon:yes gene_type:complete
MAMGTIFREQSSENVFTYGLDEAALGTGYINLYLAKSSGYLATPNQVYSGTIHTDGSWSGAGPITVHDLDFDIPIYKQTTIKGVVHANAHAFYTENSAGTTRNCRIDLIVRTWDGATETDLVTCTGNTVAMTHGGNDNMSANGTIPNTILKAGTTLRLTVHMIVINSQGGESGELDIKHDPQNRAGIFGANVESRSVIHLPIKIVE